VTGRVRIRKSGVLLRGCGQLQQHHQFPSRLYPRVYHVRHPLDRLSGIPLPTRPIPQTGHTHLLPELLVTDGGLLQVRHDHLHHGSISETLRENGGGILILLLTRTPPRMEEAIRGIQERGREVEVPKESPDKLARPHEVEEPIVEALIEAGEDCQMIVDA